MARKNARPKVMGKLSPFLTDGVIGKLERRLMSSSGGGGSPNPRRHSDGRGHARREPELRIGRGDDDIIFFGGSRSLRVNGNLRYLAVEQMVWLPLEAERHHVALCE